MRSKQLIHGRTLACLAAVLIMFVGILTVYFCGTFGASAATEHGPFTGTQGSHSGTDLTADAALTSLTAGNYYLSADTERNITVTSGVVNLCLNGHTLRGDGGSVITVDGGATLNLYDCGSGLITGGDGIHDADGTRYGAGVQLNGSAIFNMYGGTISGNNIALDTYESYGGGVNVSFGAKFTMYGGTISGNRARCGGGVAVTEDSATFTIQGGTITGNTSSSGGTSGAVYVSSTGIFNLHAGSKVNITENTAGNVFLDNTGTFNVTGAIAAESKIGVTLSGVTTFGNGYGNFNDVEPYEYFILDTNPDLFCTLSGNVLQFSSVHEINLADFYASAWRVGTRSLGNGPIYKYDSTDGSVYLTETTPPDGYTLDTTYSAQAVNSVVSYTGNSITVTSSVLANEFYSVEYGRGTNEQSEPGRYEAQMTMTIIDQVSKFVVKGAVSADNPDYGITVELSADGKTATVTKVWYIVNRTSTSANAFLSAESSADGVAADYFATAPSGYTFGVNESAFPIKMPRLKYGDDGANWITNDVVRFTLTLLNIDGTVDIRIPNISRANFGDYINNSMPVGSYRLEMEADEVSVSAGTETWWGGNVAVAVSCAAIAETYNFTVSPAPITFDLEKIDDEIGYMEYEWEYYNNRDKNTFFKEFEDNVMAHQPAFSNITRKGYWEGRYDEYYYDGAFSADMITYNFARLYNNTYMPSSGLLNKIDGGASGTYKVFFQISAPNHADLAVGADRYGYFFTVTVFQRVGAPVIDNVPYSGVKTLPNIASDSRYTVEWDEDDNYVTGGTHYVTLTLSDAEHYKWADESAAVDADKRVIRLPFTIEAVQNGWLQSPFVIGWEFGAYDARVNVLVAVARYIDEGQSVYFTVTSDAAGSNAVAGLERFAADDSAAQAKLAALPCATYYVKATLDGTANYAGIDSTPIPFRITKTVNRWVESPAIVRWDDGGYDPEVNLITASPLCGVENMIVIVRGEDGYEYYNSVTGVNELADAPVGQYILSVKVAETDNYSGLEKEVVFRVFDSAGFPWWAILLIVLGVLLIAFIVLLILYKKGVLQIVTEKMVVAMRTRADADATIAAVRAGKIAADAAAAAEQARINEEAAAAAYAALIAAEDAESDEEEALPEETDEPEEIAVYEPTESDEEVPSSAGFKKAFIAGKSARYTYSKTVLSKLITAPDAVKIRYSEIKNYLLSYKKARANMSRARESYYLGRKCYARVAMRGKTLCVYLAVDPKNYEGTKYNVNDMSEVKSYADTPCMLRVRSDRAVRYAKELIDELMLTLEAVKIDRKPENYAELFKSIEQLEKKNLLSYRGKKKRIKSDNTEKGEQ